MPPPSPQPLAGCTTSPAGCGGAGLSNERWVLGADGGLRTLLPGARCATVGAGGLVALADCAPAPLPASQAWVYDPASLELRAAGGQCLTVPSAPPPPGLAQLLVGRKLHDGAWALLALNNGPANATITCGSDCFAAMGLAQVRVRDVWEHADRGAANGGLQIAVGANGSSSLLRLTPA